MKSILNYMAIQSLRKIIGTIISYYIILYVPSLQHYPLLVKLISSLITNCIFNLVESVLKKWRARRVRMNPNRPRE